MELAQTRIPRYFIIIILVFVTFSVSFGQSDQINIKEYDGLKWEEFVKKVESQLNYRFFYNKSEIPEFSIKIASGIKSLKELLEFNLKQLKIKISVDKFGNVFLTRDASIQTSLSDDFFQFPKQSKKVEEKVKELGLE